MEKSQQDNVHQWIEHLQDNPTDKEMQEKLVLKYEGLVKSLAGKYAKNSMIHEDLVQVGMVGLLGAIERFDPSYERPFESFAIPTILGEIKRYIRDQTWSVHVPRRIKELGPKINKAVDHLTIENQQSPTILQIANYLDVSEEEILETMEKGRSYRALSVDRRIEANADGGTMSLLDVVGDSESGYEDIDARLMLEKLLPILSDRDQQVLKFIFFENLSQKETGELLGISQMHVSRIQRRSLRKLRETIPKGE